MDLSRKFGGETMTFDELKEKARARSQPADHRGLGTQKF